MKANLSKKVVVDCRLDKFLCVLQELLPVLEENLEKGLPSPDIYLCVFERGYNIELAIGSKEDIYADTGYMPCSSLN